MGFSFLAPQIHMRLKDLCVKLTHHLILLLLPNKVVTPAARTLARTHFLDYTFDWHSRVQVYTPLLTSVYLSVSLFAHHKTSFAFSYVWPLSVTELSSVCQHQSLTCWSKLTRLASTMAAPCYGFPHVVSLSNPTWSHLQGRRLLHSKGRLGWIMPSWLLCNIPY